MNFLFFFELLFNDRISCLRTLFFRLKLAAKNASKSRPFFSNLFELILFFALGKEMNFFKQKKSLKIFINKKILNRKIWGKNF